MKKIIFGFSSAFLICLAANAKDIIVTVPDEGVTFDKIDVNFDGSKTITGPKVFVNGSYTPLADTRNSATGLCSLFKSDSYIKATSDIVSEGTILTDVTSDGKIYTILTARGEPASEVLTSVICSPTQD